MTAITMNVELLSSEGIYSPGDTVAGLVNLHVTEQVVIYRIVVAIHGSGVLIHTTKDPEHRVLSRRKEMHVQEEKCLYGSKDRNKEDVYTEKGNHVLPFTFVLPENIPSSFESEEGHIRYAISSSLEGLNIPVQFEKIYISVNASLDLNTIPKSMIPSSAFIDKKSGTFCCAQSTLHAGVQIRRRGYVPGELIALNAEIHNLDSKPVDSVKAELLQIMIYHHKTRPQKTKRVASEITRGSVLPHEAQYWLEETMLIPAVVPSYLKHSRLIDVKYKIYFRISKSGMPEMVLKLPIIIGNVPLMGRVDVLTDRMEASQHSISSLEQAKLNYEPCYFGPHVISERHMNKSQEEHLFSPKYSTYSSSSM